MSKFLVTGGAGFIGSHVTHYVINQGHNALVYDNFSTGSRDNLAGITGHLEILEADIRDIDALNAAMPGVDYVIHLAAEISPVKSVEDPVFTNQVNVDGTLNVMVAAKDNGVKRAVMASSCAIYGDTGKRAQSEDFLPHPLSPYGATKLSGEYYLKVFYQIYGLETVSLRYFNVFGPRQNPKSQYAAAIPKFIDRIINGREIHIYGDGEQTRDFVYVENVARANYLACTMPNVAGKVFNIGSGETITINDLVDRLRKLSDKETKVIHDPPVLGDIKYSSSDISLARAELGFEPVVGVNEGLKRTFDHLASKSGAVG